MLRSLTLAAALLAVAPLAHAQLVVGGHASGGAPATYLIDVQTHDVTPLFTPEAAIHGLAIDDQGKQLRYTLLGAIRTWDFYTSGPSTQVLSTGIGITPALTWARGRLVAFAEGGTLAPRGFSAISESPFAVQPLLSVGLEFDFQGLGFNPRDGLFYATHSSVTVHPKGIYSIDLFGSGAISFVASFPPQIQRAPGCAVGDDRVYLVEGGAPGIFAFNLLSAAYDPQPLPNPIGVQALNNAGADWAPKLLMPVKYCTAKLNSLGCLPAISSSGHSSVAASSGFTIRASLLRNQRNGLLLFGVGGRAAIPFQNGTLCLSGGVSRAPSSGTGGSALPLADCSGTLQLDMNAFAAGALGGAPLPALSIPGVQVGCQWWSTDDSGLFATSLSDALEYTVDL